jgi:hypothetical protein
MSDFSAVLPCKTVSNFHPDITVESGEIFRSLFKSPNDEFLTPQHTSKYSHKKLRNSENSLNHLYLATTSERMSIHMLENLEGSPFRNGQLLSYQQQLEHAILEFKPYFEDALTKMGITSIAPCPCSWTYNRSTTDAYKKDFITSLADIQKKRGILNALLHLRNLAFFSKECKDAKYGNRIASSYLGVVLGYLESSFKNDKKMGEFLRWCRKTTRKIVPWEFKEKELRSPQKSVLPIHRDEAASYIRHFLGLACGKKGLLNQYAEMVVFLSLCLACARRRDNYFQPSDILKISKDDIHDVPMARKIIHQNSYEDTRKPSKTSKAHDVLSLTISTNFLINDELFPDHNLKRQNELQDLQDVCKYIKIKEADVLISQRLAHAVKMMDKFTITSKDVENRLREAYEDIGLAQSSGGISPRCFLFNPHQWNEVDTRKG